MKKIIIIGAGLTAAAPWIVEELAGLGVPFHREDGKIARRGLGG